MTRAVTVLIAVAALAGALAYLRDPPWLADQVSGLRGWQTDREGTRVRWTAGHASFFVPAEWTSLELPLRATFASPGDWPIVATIAIDDRPADRLVLADDTWRRVVLRLPPRDSRRVRRIDIRLDRVRDENHGILLGEVRGR